MLDLLTFLMSARSMLVRVTVTASPARATRQGVLFRRKVAMLVLTNVPSSRGPTITGSPSRTMPLVKTPPSTVPASGTLKISSTWNSGACWCSSGGVRVGGTAFRNLRRRLRFSPVTQDTVKMGAMLHLMKQRRGDSIKKGVLVDFTFYQRISVQHCKHQTLC